MVYRYAGFLSQISENEKILEFHLKTLFHEYLLFNIYMDVYKQPTQNQDYAVFFAHCICEENSRDHRIGRCLFILNLYLVNFQLKPRPTCTCVAIAFTILQIVRTNQCAGAKEAGFRIMNYKQNIAFSMHQTSLFIPHPLVTYYK